MVTNLEAESDFLYFRGRRKGRKREWEVNSAIEILRDLKKLKSNARETKFVK